MRITSRTTTRRPSAALLLGAAWALSLQPSLAQEVGTETEEAAVAGEEQAGLAEGSMVLDTIAVTAAPGTTTEDTGSWTTEWMRSATGLPLSQRETPQSTSVITDAQMKDRNITSVSETMDAATGVTVLPFDSERQNYFARGFAIDAYQYDGVPIPRDGVWQFGDNNADMILYDHVEIVRGATGLMQGAGEPGASINFIRKRPTSFVRREVAAALAYPTGGRMEADISGPLNESGTIRGRLLGAADAREGTLDRYFKERYVGYGALEVDLTDTTLLNLGISYQETDADNATWGGLPPWYADGSLIDWDKGFNLGADWTYIDTQRTEAFASVEHVFENGWTRPHRLHLRAERLPGEPRLVSGAGSRHLRHDLHRPRDRRGGLCLGRRLLRRRLHAELAERGGERRLPGVRPDARVRRRPVRLEGRGRLRPAQRRHGRGPDRRRLRMGRLLAQARFRRRARQVHQRDPAARPLRDHPVPRHRRACDHRRRPGELVGRRVGRHLERPVELRVQGRRHALSRLHLRLQRHVHRLRQHHEHLQAAAGAGHRPAIPRSDLRLELRARRQGRPLRRRDVRCGGGVPDQKDVAEWAGEAIAPDGAPYSYYELIDGTTTRGFELEAAGAINARWNASFGYTYATSEDDNGDEVNSDTPRHTLKAATDYRIAGILDERLTVGGAVRWQSAIDSMPWDGGLPNIEQDAYAVFDLNASYDVTETSVLTLSVNNVLDEKYYASTGFYNTVLYGDGIGAELMLRSRF